MREARSQGSGGCCYGVRASLGTGSARVLPQVSGWVLLSDQQCQKPARREECGEACPCRKWVALAVLEHGVCGRSKLGQIVSAT